MPNRIKAALFATVALLAFGLVSTPAGADQNGGYSAASPTTSADYFDPHDQDVHGDQPKAVRVGEFGYEINTAGQPALAGTPCPAGKLCTYWSTLWTGSMYYYSLVNGPYPVCVHIGEPWNNDISSARNYSSRAARFHNDPNCGNSWDSYTVYPGSSVDWGWPDQADNQWSSFQWMP